jgi:signal transduction histidine kinase
LDFAALAQSVVDDRAEMGARASYTGPDRLVLIGQSLGLKRLVANLVENAIHYAGEATVELRIEGGRAVLDVADNGPGVPEEERERIFKPFARGSTSTGSGAGLGLASARAVARAHGGDVVMLSNAGRGARARATIPLALPG